MFSLHRRDHPMNRTPVASSNVASVGYDDAQNVLEVEFLNGRIYQYYNVPPSVHTAFMSSASKGQFVHYQLKDKYPCTQVQ
jgi:hypothetical protein